MADAVIITNVEDKKADAAAAIEEKKADPSARGTRFILAYLSTYCYYFFSDMSLSNDKKVEGQVEAVVTKERPTNLSLAIRSPAIETDFAAGRYAYYSYSIVQVDVSVLILVDV